MTLPIERAHAIINLGDAVMALAPYAARRSGNQQLAKVPVALIEDLMRRLKHYPTTYDVERLAKASPDILQFP